MNVCMAACGRPEVDIGCPPPLLFTLFFETWSLTKLELTNAARLAHQQDPETLLTQPP